MMGILVISAVEAGGWAASFFNQSGCGVFLQIGRVAAVLELFIYGWSPGMTPCWKIPMQDHPKYQV